MQTLRRIAAVLTFPTIAYLGAACERETPTAPTARRPVAATLAAPTTRWVNRVDPTPPFYSPPGTSCNDPGYPTIGDAVTASMSGDIIQVCASAMPYTENVLVNVTNLTLLGAQAGNPVALRTFGGPLESTVMGANPTASVPVFQVTATNVTIDGFSVTNTVVLGDAFGIGTGSGAGSGAVITNNIIHMVTTPDVNGAAQAIYLQNGPDNVSILGNDLSDVTSAKSAKGIFIGDAASMNASTSIVITGNSISNITSLSIMNVPKKGAYGILINNGNGSTSNSGLEIRNNTITYLNGAAWVHAIGLEANTPGVVVQGNSISNLMAPPNAAVAVWFEVTDPSYSTAHVNQNNLDVTIADFGIAVDPSITSSGVVDGTCNWWGDPSGPGPVGTGLGARVSPKVAFIPWLLEPAPSGACRGGAPSGGTVTGGGQIDVMSGTTSGVGSFGFSANAGRHSGHLDYLNHLSSTHLNCTVNVVLIDATKTKAHLSGTCSSNNYTGNFNADVQDNGTPGKNKDTFTITYGTNTDGAMETIRSGNIEIH